MNKEKGLAIIEASIILSIIVLILLIFYSMVFIGKIYLVEKDWECMGYEKLTHNQMVGSIPVTVTTDICVNYARR